jgi:protein involved in polysaccharide export with SLBB domain
MKHLLRLCFANAALLLASAVHANPQSNVDMMEMLNSISPLKPFYQIEIFVNDDLSGREEVTIDQSGNICSKYSGQLRAAGRSSKQLAYEIRRIVQQQEHAATLRLPKWVQMDPLVRVSVIGLFQSPQIPASIRYRKEYEPIEPRDIIRIWKDGQPQSEITQRVAVTGEILAFNELIQVAGLNIRQVEDSLRRRFGESSINVAHYRKEVPPQQYSVHRPRQCPTAVVFGKTAFQGRFCLDPKGELRVSELIRLAGGFAKKPLPNVRIIRQTPLGDKSIQVHACAVWKDHNPEYDLFIRPNDVLIVK